jgi:hypothetical protein
VNLVGSTGSSKKTKLFYSNRYPPTSLFSFQNYEVSGQEAEIIKVFKRGAKEWCYREQ